MTAAKVQTNVVILWEHEIRIAAKALGKLKGKNLEKEDYIDAMKACWTAIYHPDLVRGDPVTIMSANSLLQSELKREQEGQEADDG